MSLHAVLGHGAARRALADAAQKGELPGALLFHGPPGIGKQRLALWLGQLLLCERPGEAGPCNGCAACRLALRIEHPDLHWFFPLPRPRGVSAPERLAEALEEARAAELVARRTEPFRPLAPMELAGLFLAQMQTVRRSAAARPAMASRKVFVIGDAERLVPQEASPEAANALLKLLEEPSADTTIVLTVGDPEALLPTIRSRLLPVRLRPLPLTELAAFLVEQRHADPRRAETVARLAQGSLGAALAFLGAEGDDDPPLEKLRQEARSWLDAAAATNAEEALSLAITTAPSGARGAFSDTLAFLTLWLRDLAAVDAGALDVVINVDAVDGLRSIAARLRSTAGRVPAAIERVETVAHWAQLNINPQLALSWLLRGLRRDLGVSAL